ncbi:MAG: glutamate racemase [Bdellovibrionaceae bacterium]|nr:glutamate racemase [Bdellovibrio sp.]
MSEDLSSKNHDDRAIGVFDSGIGGITVLRELVKNFPNENFIYLGDTARLPYGSKSAETVRNYSVQNMKFLMSRNVKALIVACNTASTQVFEDHFEKCPVYNVIGPGAALAAAKTKNKKIAVLATRAAIKAGSYTQKILAHLPDAEVFTQACPLFVPLAEEGWHDDPITNLIAFRYLQNLKSADIDTVVLGCTHYPLIRTSIEKVFGPHVHLIDSGVAMAQQIGEDFNSGKIKPNQSGNVAITIALTDTSEHFEALSAQLLAPVSSVQITFETVSVI